MNKTVGIIFVGTGKYHAFFEDFYYSVNKYFLPKHKKIFFVFTDANNLSLDKFKKKRVILQEIENQEWPFPSLLRFNYVFENRRLFDATSHLFYIDSDLHPVNTIEEDEIFIDGKPHVAIQHPSYYDQPFSGALHGWPFETNQASCASVQGVKDCDLSQYLCGGFWGGETRYILRMCGSLAVNVDIDLSNNVIAIWYDESHINKYLSQKREKINALHPGYCYPKGRWHVATQNKIKQKYPIKMVHLCKKTKFG